MNVVVSHINEEAGVAAVLAQWIESSLDRDVILSGEAQSIGEQWLAELDRTLGKAKVLLLLCSGRSIGRPWIGFQAGCASLKRVPIVAVCHAGCSGADLLPPLQSVRAFDLTDPASCQDLLESLAALLQRKRVPRVDFGLMVTELAAAVDRADGDPSTAPAATQVAKPGAARAGKAAPPQPAAAPARDAAVATAQPLEVRLLVAMKRVPEFTSTAAGLAESLGEQERRIRDCLDKLVSNLLLTQRASIHPTDPETRYALTDRGRSYLARHLR